MSSLFAGNRRGDAGRYGSAEENRRLYYDLRDMTREQIIRTYSSCPENMAVAMRYAFIMRLAGPLASGDLASAKMLYDRPVTDPALRSFVDIVFPRLRPQEARLPLVMDRRDFGRVIENLFRLDQEYVGRWLLMRAFVTLALDHGLIKP